MRPLSHQLTLCVCSSSLPQLSLSDFDPLHAGDPKEPSLVAYSSIFFPQPRAKPNAGEDLYALYDLAATDPASLAPDWTTVYYKARMGKTKKTVAKGYRTVQYIAADGSVTAADLPMEAWLPGESAPFPTCMVPQPVNAMQILLSVAAAGGETAPAPTPTAAAAAASTSPATAAAASASVTPTAGSAAIASPRIPSPAVHNGAASSSAAAAAAPSARVPSPAIHRVASPAVHGTHAAAAAASSTGAASLSIDVHKRKRTDSMSDVAGGGGNVSPASAASGSAPPSPSASAAAKRARKAAKKEKQQKGGETEKEKDKAGSWHIDLPADPRHHALLDRWSVETLQLVVPALKPLAIQAEKTAAADASTAEPGVKREQPAAASEAAPADSSSAVPPATAASDHPLLKSLQREFAQWNRLHGGEQPATNGASSSAAGAAASPSAAPSSSSASALCPFVSFKSALGCTHHFDQLQFLPEKQLAVAPFVLDYLHGEEE